LWWEENGGEDGGEDEDEVRNFHSAQLCFTRNKVPIGVGNSFLKTNAL